MTARLPEDARGIYIIAATCRVPGPSMTREDLEESDRLIGCLERWLSEVRTRTLPRPEPVVG